MTHPNQSAEGMEALARETLARVSETPVDLTQVREIVARLETMYSHRGDGIPTQYVNPDGPDAVKLIERLLAALETATAGGGE